MGQSTMRKIWGWEWLVFNYYYGLSIDPQVQASVGWGIIIDVHSVSKVLPWAKRQILGGIFLERLFEKVF